MTLFNYEAAEYQPTDAERREAAEAARRESPRTPDAPPLLPYGVPGNGVSQLVGAFSRGRRR